MTKAAEPINGRALKLDADPFKPTVANHHLSRQAQTAFHEIVRQLIQQAPVILVTGPASAGKTLLVDMTARLCRDMGLSVRQVDRGDLLHIGLDQCSDVLLVDEANSIEDKILETFSPERRNNTAATTIFLGLPSCTARFAATVNPSLIQLDLLSRSDAECYLRERAASAGFPDLFSDDALELIVGASNGSPRLLRRIASEAFFTAASDGALQIGDKHAASVLAMQLPSSGPARRDKQSAAPEGIPFGQARIDDDRFAREKGPPQIFGAFTRVEPVSEEPRASAECALNFSDRAPDIRQDDAKLGDDGWIGNPDEISVARWETPSRNSVTPTLARRGAFAACAAITIAAVVGLVIAKPWAGTGPVFSNLTRVLPSQPVAVGNTDGFKSTASPVIPAAPSVLSNGTENSVNPEPVPSAPQNVAQPRPEKTAVDVTQADKSESREAAARSDADAGPPLTAEEKAAVARGIQEMERAATQARARIDRR